MSDNEQENHSEPSPEEKEKEQKIIKEIEKLRFFLEDAQESFKDEDYDELKTTLNKCNAIHDKLNELIANLQELKLELGNLTSRSIRQWKKNLKANYTPLVEIKLELQRSLDKRQREESETATEECLGLKHKKEEEFRRMMHEREKELLEEKMKAELKLTEKKMEMERAEKQRRTKLPELKITPFKGTPNDWIRFENMFISQIDKSPISDEEKFGYLLELVGPKVRDRFSNLKPGSVGYKTAWERLQSEYGHSKLVSAAHMDELINLASVRGTNYGKVHEFYEKLAKNFDALQSLGEGDTLKALVIPTINKLPQVKPDLVRTDDDWEEWDMLKLLNSIQKWLKRNRVEEGPKEDNHKKRENHFYANKTPESTTPTSGKSPKCLYCEGNHWGEACKTQATIEDRKRFFADKKLCFNCGRNGHQASQCRGRGCFKCKGRHHTSLCTRNNEGSDKPQQPPVLNGYTPSTEKSLPAIIPVQINNEVLWAFLDTGSGRNFVSSEAVKKLNLKPVKHENRNIVTVNGVKKQSMPIFDIEIKSLDDRESERIELTGSKMPDFTTINRPTIKELKEKYPHARGKTFQYVESEKYKIDIILSDNVYCKIRTERVYKGQPEDPIVEETSFGWVIHGGSEYSDSGCMYIKELDSHCERLYALDVLGVDDRGESDSWQVNKDFRENIERQDDGRYVVSVPWVPGSVLADNNERASRRRLANTERKLKQNPTIEAEYRQIVNEQLEAGVIERAPAEPDGDKVFYMPHKPVVREDASTTKVRMVFDASAKPSHEANSINDCMFTGPPLQPLLWDIMIRARMSTHLLLGDIQKAFLQIGIKREDRDAFRFLFNVNSDKEEHLRFTRVPFGAEASPFLLGATLQYHYDQQPPIFQDTVETLRENTYMDNLMKGGSNEDELEKFKQEATEILESARFPVHKWESDIASLEDEDVSNPTKFLGHVWDKRDDTLEVVVNKPEPDKPLTKMKALKQLGSIYDPLGIMSPVTVEGKRIYREVCEENKTWDSEASPQLQKQWFKWTGRLRNVKIPRAVAREVNKIKAVHLHVFADSSNIACSAVAIAVVEHETGTVKSLLTSKSRISKRNTSIPRLELVSGHMAANLVKNLRQALHSWPIQSITVWMDSMVALYWICNPGKQWKVFVANRVNKIAQITEQTGIQWRHCPTDKNIADLGSRGATIDKLEREEWFTGPEWLLHEERWPEQPNLKSNTTTDAEHKPVKESVMYTQKTAENPDEWEQLLAKKPYWKTLRVTAWTLRFVNNTLAKKRSTTKRLGPLTTDELELAENQWIKKIQKQVDTDLEAPGWKIVKDPETGVLRCQGRIVGYQPIYVEDKTFAEKLIQHMHEEVNHLGVANTMATIRERWWIQKLRSKVKRVINECKTCRVYNTMPYGTTTTAPLPTFRSEEGRPFQTTGVDFAGPLQYKISSSENGKCYILVFTCATCRAVHLEVTKSQTAEEFQQKLTSFITRRTRPELMVSDNAQTFKATADWIEEIRKSEELQDFLAKQHTRWQFNLAKSPWWGGMYERLIRDIKKTLYKTMGRSNLTFEHFEAVVMDIERHLNNRPLTYVESEAGEELVLTPNVIMWGQDAHIIEDIEADTDEVSKFYRRLTEKKQHVWKRWKTEYIHSLMESHRITKGTTRHPEVGEIVLVVGDEKNRGEWRKSKVVELIKGRDDVVRGVRLLANGRRIERPLSLVCPLEIKAAEQYDVPTVTTQPHPTDQGPRRSQRAAAKQATVAVRAILEDEDND